jgi:hypothetical protein
MLIAAVAVLLIEGGCATSNDSEVEEFAIYFSVVTDTDSTPNHPTREEIGEFHD